MTISGRRDSSGSVDFSDVQIVHKLAGELTII